MITGMTTVYGQGEDLLPWESQHNEASKAFHAFTHYRDLGTVRSFDRAWHQHEVTCLKIQESSKRRPQTWIDWSSNWGWVQRVASWDKEQDRIVREKVSRDRTDAQARHARMAQAALQGLTVPSAAILQVLQDPSVMQRIIQEARVSTRGLLQLIGLLISATHAIPGLVEVERLALGLTTELIEVVDSTSGAIGHKIPNKAESVALAIALLDSIAGTGPGTPPKVDD